MLTFALLRVFLIVLLVAANAFFAAAEFALVSIRETRILQLIEARRIGARTVLRLHQSLDDVVNGVQFGITLASLTLGWVGEPILAHLIEAGLGHAPHSRLSVHAVAIGFSFALITYLHVLLGELVPKTVALQQAERVALAVAAPMEVFLMLARPFLFFTRRSAGVVLRMFGARGAREGAVHSPDELKLIVTASRRFGQIPEFQEDMIHRVLELDNLTAREVMVPRPDIFSLSASLLLEEALRRVSEEQHSRIPVYDPKRGPEQIVGVLYARDLMRWMRLKVSLPEGHAAGARLAQMTVSRIMRNVLVVPETKILAELLVEFQDRKRHLAVVVDEFGSTAGVITVEDIVAQVVGEIKDEFDNLAGHPVLEESGSLVLDGATGLRDLESDYEVVLPRDEGFETLAGFMMAYLQRIPRPGDGFVFQERRFTVEQMEAYRIAKVKIAKAGAAPPAPALRA
jgi:CBS domain containing-hemolysin-like protein